MSPFRWRTGFTLVEIMVVIFILAILVTLVTSNWMTARTKTQTKTCVRNLHKIAQSKEQFALDNQKQNGDAVTMNDLVPQYLRSEPVCPAGGTYTVNPVGTDPTCSLGGDHSLP